MPPLFSGSGSGAGSVDSVGCGSAAGDGTGIHAGLADFIFFDKRQQVEFIHHTQKINL